MTLGDIRKRVGLALNVAGGGTVDGDERDLLDSYANEAVEQILLRTKVNKKTAQITLTAGVGDYTLDPIMLAFDDIWITPGIDSDYQPMLVPVDSYDIRSMRNLATAVAAPAAYYAFEGNVIMLYPTPATGDKMHIVYVPKQVNLLSDDAHDPSLSDYGGIPAEYHHLIETYTKWKMADYADDASSQVGQKYQTDFETGVIAMKVALARKAGVRTGYATVGRRGRFSRYASPGVDTGG